VRYEFQPIQLDDGSIDWQAVLQARVAHPLNSGLISRRVELLVDSGSTDCMLHADLLKPLGLELKRGTLSGVIGLSGLPEAQAYYHKVKLVIENHVVTVRAAFVADLCIAGILGRRGFFDEFRVFFDAPAKPSYFEIELPPSSGVRT
jgi:Aspartyl protease